MHKKNLNPYSFPIASVLLGGAVGIFTFLHQPAPSQEKYTNERFFRPIFFGVTTTYLILSAGINLKLTKDSKSKHFEI
jgi:hypothetical protein